MKNLAKVFFSFLLLCCYGKSFSQQQGFKIRYQNEIHGDIALIGNNIVSEKADKPYNQTGKKAKLNDQIEMKYVNVDKKNPQLFSSSSATLKIEGADALSVAYAGLYWVATYPYNTGKKGKKSSYTVKDPKRENFDVIRIKYPNQTEYKLIAGQVLFDGKDNTQTDAFAPYLCYADITTDVQNLITPQGEYTVANVRSALGNIPGGASAGWALVVVYQKPDALLQQITTYDGFEIISSGSKTINFTGFKTPGVGNIQGRLLGGALDGDLGMSGDAVAIISQEKKEFLGDNKGVRSKNNFFNSSITLDNKHVTNRNLASLNTLGFDLFSLNIPNDANSLIANNTDNISLEYTTKADSFYIFFTAMAIPTLPIKANAELEQSYTTSPLNADTTTTQIIVNNPSNKPAPISKAELSELPKEVIYSTTHSEGYYTVVGVFHNPNYADNYIKHLSSIGIQAKKLHNTKVGKYYVYAYKSKDYEDALTQRNKLKVINDPRPVFNDLKETWVIEVKKATGKK